MCRCRRPLANRPSAWWHGTKIQLAPGESKTVTLTIDPQSLSIYNVEKQSWELLPGEYRVHAGGSSRNTPLTAAVRIAAR